MQTRKPTPKLEPQYITYRRKLILRLRKMHHEGMFVPPGEGWDHDLALCCAAIITGQAGTGDMMCCIEQEYTTDDCIGTAPFFLPPMCEDDLDEIADEVFPYDWSVLKNSK